MRPVVRASGGNKSVGTGIAISAVLLAGAIGAVLYTNSQPPIGAEPHPAEEPAKKRKPQDSAPEGPPRRVTTDIFTKEAQVVPGGSFELVLSSDKKGQIEFEILPKDGPVDIAMIRVRTADQVTKEELAELRSKFQRYEPGRPAVLRGDVLAGEVEYCSVANPGAKPVSVTATGRTITVAP
jgi:hypothetical protein